MAVYFFLVQFTNIFSTRLTNVSVWKRRRNVFYTLTKVPERKSFCLMIELRGARCTLVKLRRGLQTKNSVRSEKSQRKVRRWKVVWEKKRKKLEKLFLLELLLARELRNMLSDHISKIIFINSSHWLFFCFFFFYICFFFFRSSIRDLHFFHFVSMRCFFPPISRRLEGS